MKKAIILLQLILSVHTLAGYGQTVLFSEDFESGEIPLNWKEEFSKGAVSWRYDSGGYTTTPGIPYSKHPIAAHGGKLNALFQYQSSNSEATKLVTKKISALEFAIKPELHFFNAQVSWKHGSEYYNDILRVYYKSNASDPWTLLRTYSDATTDWVERIIPLPENDLSADYYLAFEGETKWGWGTCVDDIQIIETGILQKYLGDISVAQASDVPISSGTTLNPILRINLKVMGNSGTLPLNSLTVNALNTTDDDIPTGGVKLFLTRDPEFNADTPVGSGESLVSGQAVFNNLNFDLPTGYSYLWVTYDVKTDAGHRDIVDAKLLANSININGNTYLPSEQSPDGSRTILRTLQSDNFESGLNWTLTGEFQYGSPLGLGGSQGNPDPDHAYSGSNIIGTDLTGLGDYPGDYEKNLPDDGNTAVSDTFDFTYYNDLSLRYMRYLNIGINDEASIDISADGGKTWQVAWGNPSMILDNSWKLHEVDITALAARKKKVLVRYRLGPTNDYWQLSGWNIDDFSVTGSYVTRDAGISRIVTPQSGCGHTASDSVTVVVKNYGAGDSFGSIPLYYSLNGGTTKTYDTIKQVIPYGDSLLFTFKKKANLSATGIYSFVVSTRMSGDEDSTNNRKSATLYVQTTRQTDYTENFESQGGLWIPYSPKMANDWEWGIPGFGIMPPSGSKAWMTQLLSDYSNEDSSFIESGCYQNLDGIRKIVQLKYWNNSEDGKDGAALQYSVDNGQNWQLTDTLVNGWTWYTDTVEALHSPGWSGNSNGWVTAKLILPQSVTQANQMKFRILFASGPDSSDIGFVVDDFSIYTAPPDVGVSSIDSFATRCQYLNPDSVTVNIRNYGINTVKKDTRMIVGYDFNQVHTATDTFYLAADLMPGKTIKHTFSRTVDVTQPGHYALTAYTRIESDPYFYGANNDTVNVGFDVLPNPLTLMMDTLSTREPDTVILRPYYNADYDYQWQDMSTGPEYHVPQAGVYKVKVTATRGNGCISYDSTYVQLLFNDSGVDSLVNPYNHCGLGTQEYLRIRVRNFGTDSIPAGQKIPVGYTLNSGPAVLDTLLLSNTLLSGKTIVFTFSNGPVDMSGKGTYHFKAFTSFPGDTLVSNDTLNKDVEIYGHPSIDLGPDFTIEAVSYTLDAGTGYGSYLWDNGVTSQTRLVGTSGQYWVRVTDDHQCDNADTIYVRLKIRDIRPDGFASPLSGCQFTAGVPVSLKVLNSGTDTVPSGQQIQVSYVLNSGPRISESFNLAADMLPGEFTIHTFNPVVDMTDTADYHFSATAVMDGDIQHTNDTASYPIYRYPKPVVDFGLDSIVYLNGIDLELEAGYSPYYLYDWTNGFHDHLYTATQSGTYGVWVTDARTSCHDGDTVKLFLIYNDVGITATDMPDTGCTGDFRSVNVEVSNLGTTNIGPAAPIYVACDVDGQRVALDTLVRTTNFFNGSHLNLQMTAPIPVHDSGSHVISLYSIYSNDMKPGNDTLSVIFRALARPAVDFGDINGHLNVDLPYILDAGEGQYAYLWQDGSSGQTYTVTQNGTYSVTVTGQNNCETNKVVIINEELGFNDLKDSKSEILLYPNPNGGVFYVSLPDQHTEKLELIVVSSTGQTVYHQPLHTLAGTPVEVRVGNLPRGLYEIVIRGESPVYMGKMVIQ